MERPGRKSLFNNASMAHGSIAENNPPIESDLINSLVVVLDSVIRGGLNERVDVGTLAEELQPIGGMVNAIIEQHTQQAQNMRRCDTLIRESPLPIVLMDRNYALIGLNEAYEDLMQMPRDRLMAMKAGDFKINLVSGDKTDMTFNGIRTKAELKITFADGAVKFVEQYGIPVQDDSGITESAYFMFRDITEVRESEVQIQKEIAKAEALQLRSESIVQENPMPMILVDMDFKVLVTNQAFLDMSGMPREKVIGMSARDFRLLEQKGEGLGYVIKQDARSVGEVTVDLPSGIKILEQYGIPIRNAKGKTANILIVYNDITELRHEMEEIQKLKKRAESFIQENPQAIAVLRSDKSRIDLNTEYEHIWRGTYDDLMRKKLYDFDITVTGGDDMYASFDTKRLATTDMEVAWPNGEKNHFKLYQLPILDENGEIDVNYYIYQDLTVIKEKEFEVQQLMEDAQREAEQLGASASQLATSMALMSKGDLAVFAEIGENDPLEALKNDFNSSIESIKSIIAEVNGNSDLVMNTSNEVNLSAGEIAKATEQVADSTQKSAEFTRDLMAQIEDINREISDLSASIEEIASTSQEVLDGAQKAAGEGSKAAAIGKDAQEKMEAVGVTSAQTVEDISALNEQMHEISHIVKLITSIAGQTNLLALNAAIEAARAGEHGRGFSVVAGEIRNLAGEVKEASETIEDRIGTILANSDRTTESMKSSHHEIQGGVDRVKEAIEALHLIVAEVERVALGITEISKATEAQAVATNRVMQSMEDSTNMTRENRELIEEMAALAEEVSASTEEVGSASHEMASMAESLKKLIGQFKLE